MLTCCSSTGWWTHTCSSPFVIWASVQSYILEFPCCIFVFDEWKSNLGQNGTPWEQELKNLQIVATLECAIISSYHVTFKWFCLCRVSFLLLFPSYPTSKMPNQHKPTHELSFYLCSTMIWFIDVNLLMEAPLDELAPHIWRYWRHRITRVEMVPILLNKHIDTEVYGLRQVMDLQGCLNQVWLHDSCMTSVSSLKRMMKKLNIEGVRVQHHTIQSIHPAIMDIRRRFPTIGSREIINILALHYDIRVPRWAVHLPSLFSIW